VEVGRRIRRRHVPLGLRQGRNAERREHRGSECLLGFHVASSGFVADANKGGGACQSEAMTPPALEKVADAGVKASRVLAGVDRKLLAAAEVAGPRFVVLDPDVARLEESAIAEVILVADRPRIAI